MIGGKGYAKIRLVYEIRRTLTFVANPGFVPGDIGKTCKGAVTGDTGELISYNNVAKTCVIEMDDSGDLFDQVELVSVTGGVGSGNTTGASVLTESDYFQFTAREEKNIFLKFVPVLDCEDKRMESGFKRFEQGSRFWCYLDFLADDWVITLSNLGYSLQKFIKNMQNWKELIYIISHIDKPNQEYLVKRMHEYGFDYPFERWVGQEGSFVFRGDEILDVDLEE